MFLKNHKQCRNGVKVTDMTQSNCTIMQILTAKHLCLNILAAGDLIFRKHSSRAFGGRYDTGNSNWRLLNFGRVL